MGLEKTSRDESEGRNIFVPGITLDEKKKIVYIEKGIFFNNLIEAYYSLNGYEVKFGKNFSDELISQGHTRETYNGGRRLISSKKITLD